MATGERAPGSKEEITLEHHFEQQLTDIKELLEAKFCAIEKSTDLAVRALSIKLESMNELRGAMKDQMANSFTKPEHNLYAEKVEADIRVLRENKATLEGKASQRSVTWAIVISVGGFLLALVGLLIRILPYM